VSAVPTLQALSQIDRLIHEPARLMILSILAGADAVEFRYIEEITGLTRGNLSSHMSKLESAELLTVDKTFRGKLPVTTLRITVSGRAALTSYRERLAQIVSGIPR
jgi:DNA-binding transcriptional ArsR family regulator